MSYLESKRETIELAKQYNSWISSGGKYELYPTELEDIEHESLTKLIVAALFHGILFLVSRIFFKLRCWRLARLMARVRLKSDKHAICPRGCGFNQAYTNVGLAEFKQGNITAAIEALKVSSLIYPCSHNTSFGLSKKLVRVLEGDQSSVEAVKDYLEIDQYIRGA